MGLLKFNQNRTLHFYFKTQNKSQIILFLFSNMTVKKQIVARELSSKLSNGFV